MSDISQIHKKSIAKALFLDRDGTLNVDYGYVFQPQKIQLLPNVIDAIHIFQKLNYLLFLFTNQPGIERGMYTRADVDACHQRLFQLLGENPFTEICIAQEANYAPENYRKPSPKFINEMVAKYQLNPKQCYMVGDKETDAFAGINGNIQSVLLDSDYPRSERCVSGIRSGNILTFSDLISFARYLQKIDT